MIRWIATFKSFFGRLAREAFLYPKILVAGKDKRLVFLPSSGREQSGLQRAYFVAESLEKMGWNPVVVPKHLSARQRRRILKFFDPDLVLLQKCRHPLNRLTYLQDYDLVLDVDDADFLDERLEDVMAEVANHAQGVICGSHYIQRWARGFNDTTVVIWTGSFITGGSWPAHAERDRVVAWAQSNPLAADEEFAFIEDVILRVHAREVPFTLRLYGWRWPAKHPSLKRLRDAGVALDLVAPMPYAAFLLSLRDVSVGLSPIVGKAFSRGKSFGKILGYLDAKVPVICSDAADHAAFFVDGSGIVSDDADIWVNQIIALLADPQRCESISEQAYNLYTEHLDIESSARKVSDFLSRLPAIK